MSFDGMSAGLFDCFADPKECLIGWCLPGLSFSQTHHRLNTNPSTIVGHEPINPVSLGACGAIWCCFPVGWILPFWHRQQIRERYGIEGTPVGDCLQIYCCSCCALIQNEKEVKMRESSKNVVASQPAKNPGMSYTAQN